MAYAIETELNQLKILLETREALKRWLDLVSYPDITLEKTKDDEKTAERKAKLEAVKEKLKFIDEKIWENLKKTLT